MADAALKEEKPAMNSAPDVDPSFDVGALLEEVEAQAHEAGADVPPPPVELAGLVTPDATPDPSLEAPRGEAPAALGPLDDEGQAFDPTIHATDENGDPKKTKAGRWAKKRGRKARGEAIRANPETSKFSPGQTAQPEQAVPQAPGPDLDAIKRAQERLETGKTMANLTVLASVMAGGEDFAADQKEVDQMGAAYAAYLEARGIDAAMSPEMVLAGQLSNYFLPRVFKPKVKDRFRFGFKWAKEKVLSVFAKAKARGNIKRAKEQEEKETAEPTPPPNMPEWPF